MRLLHGDCLELMKQIPDGSIDFILTDPPYGTTACKWDNVIPFESMWEELKRIRKPNAAIALFGSEPFSSHLRMSNIKEFKYDWIWEKTKASDFMNGKNKPMCKHEIISIFSNGTVANKSLKKMPYYPQGLTPFNKTVKRCLDTTSQEHGLARKSMNNEVFRAFVNYPTRIVKFNSQGKTVHPTQKPVALLEYLIKTYTLEGETVLDFTMGSGSTGVACKNLNRKFIGIEKDDKYFEIAKQRIPGG